MGRIQIFEIKDYFIPFHYIRNDETLNKNPMVYTLETILKS